MSQVLRSWVTLLLLMMPMMFGLAVSTKHFGRRFNRDWKAGHVGISLLSLAH
jgi:hypothetical protein